VDRVHPLFRRRWDRQDEDDDDNEDDKTKTAAIGRSPLQNFEIKRGALAEKYGECPDKRAACDESEPGAPAEEGSAPAESTSAKSTQRNDRNPAMATFAQSGDRAEKVEERRTSGIRRALSAGGPQLLRRLSAASSLSEESTVLRTRVKSVVEMMTSSPPPPDRRAKRRHPMGHLSSADTESTATTTLITPTPATATTSRTVTLENSDGVVVPAKPPRLLAAVAISAEIERDTQADKRTLHEDQSSAAVPPKTAASSRSLSFVDTSTSPYSSDPEDLTEISGGTGPPTAGNLDLWRSPPEYSACCTTRSGNDDGGGAGGHEDGGTGFNNGEKWSYLPGRWTCNT
jgi:hypothetical protein